MKKLVARPSAELKRTIEFQPENWAAQMELGRLQLAAGQQKEAKGSRRG